jgi:Divergent InlB B-repeat domain
MSAISRTRFSVPALAAAALALCLALPAAASAAQTLTVEKAGAGTGTVTSSPSGIECGPDCQASFADSTVVTLTATPGPNSAPAAWSGCGSVNGENKCIVTMSAAKAVTATFALVQRQLTVSKEGSATGTVTSSPAGISCGATCTATYVHGTLVTLTGAPGPNAQPAKWTGCGFVDAEDRCLVTMSAAREVTATFDLVKRQLTVNKVGSAAAISSVTSTPAGISCGEACQAGFDHGTVVTLSGAPGAHTSPAQWSGCDKVTAEDKCEVTMSSARTVTATFDLIQFGLSLTKEGGGAKTSSVTSSPAGISCGEACQANFTQGAKVTLTAVRGPHVLVPQWSGCDSVTPERKCLVTISAAKAVAVDFELEPGYFYATLSVIKSGTGTGTVTGSPAGISCGSACAVEVLTQTKVTLIATPDEGSAFDHWSGGGCSGIGPCETTIKGSETIKAIFSAIGQRTLTITKAGSGTGTVTSTPLGTGILCGATCSSQVVAGTKVILKAKAAKGSTFTGFSGACAGTAACKVLMNEARSVTATFEAPAAAPQPAPAPKPLRCKKGFKKRKVHGKARCVKVKRHHKHHPKRGAPRLW